MIAATSRNTSTSAARLLIVASNGDFRHELRSDFAHCFEPGDLIVANDAATIPASLSGTHARTEEPIEVRLAGRRSLDFDDLAMTAVVFGRGDYRTRTEDRPPPPALEPGDTLRLGPLRATVLRALGHPRWVDLRFTGSADEVWAGIARHGDPIQYAHVSKRLALWDVWTSFASRPVAFEAPSAGFLLDWNLLRELRERGVGFATLTHAAGISSTGDSMPDRRLPLDEPYQIPDSTARAIAETRARDGRIVALGTTVARALEHAVTPSGDVFPGSGLADQKIGHHTELRVVDAIVTGVHETGTSHHDLLHAFADESVIRRLDEELETRGYRSHEFGDSVLIERPRSDAATILPRPAGTSPLDSIDRDPSERLAHPSGPDHPFGW